MEKRHTLKTQVVADKASRKILCTDFDKGRKHDFKLFKDSKVCLKKETKYMAGIVKLVWIASLCSQ
jgi:hypothetical protein